MKMRKLKGKYYSGDYSKIVGKGKNNLPELWWALLQVDLDPVRDWRLNIVLNLQSSIWRTHSVVCSPEIFLLIMNSAMAFWIMESFVSNMSEYYYFLTSYPKDTHPNQSTLNQMFFMKKDRVSTNSYH